MTTLSKVENPLCSLEVEFNGVRQTIMEISLNQIYQIREDSRYTIIGEPIPLGYDKEADCAKWGNE